MDEPPQSTKVYVAVGANIDPEVNIPKALALLARCARVTDLSMFYRTAPLGASDAPVFLNGVCAVVTELSARAFKYRLLRLIEQQLGRKRTEDPNAPRPIDFDILVYGNNVVDEPGLRIPDPALYERPFVSVPLLELAPDLVLPDTGIALAALVGSDEVESLTPVVEFTQRLRMRIVT